MPPTQPNETVIQAIIYIIIAIKAGVDIVSLKYGVKWVRANRLTWKQSAIITGKAYVIYFAAGIGLIVLFGMLLLVTGDANSQFDPPWALATLLGFVIVSSQYGKWLKSDDGQPIGMNRGLLLSLIQTVPYIAVILIILIPVLIFDI